MSRFITILQYLITLHYSFLYTELYLRQILINIFYILQRIYARVARVCKVKILSIILKIYRILTVYSIYTCQVVSLFWACHCTMYLWNMTSLKIFWSKLLFKNIKIDIKKIIFTTFLKFSRKYLTIWRTYFVYIYRLTRELVACSSKITGQRT